MRGITSECDVKLMSASVNHSTRRLHLAGGPGAGATPTESGGQCKAYCRARRRAMPSSRWADSWHFLCGLSDIEIVFTFAWWTLHWSGKDAVDLAWYKDRALVAGVYISTGKPIVCHPSRNHEHPSCTYYVHIIVRGQHGSGRRVSLSNTPL